MSSVKIAVAGGGTGGHLFPALAIIAEIEARGAAEIEYFGTSRGPEARIIPQRGYRFHRIWIKGYPRKLKPEILLLPLKMVVSVFQCLFHLTRFWPDCMLATGGYVCLPFMLAGKLLGMRMVIHEQNSLPGITTRIGANWAGTVFYSFRKSEAYFHNHRDAVLSGNPARTDLGAIPRDEAIAKLGLNPDRKTVLVFGGSQGAFTLNRAVNEVLKELSERFNLIWQTGRGNLPEKTPSGVLAKEFFDDMGTLYSAADLAFCRAGATTLTELAAVGLPAVLVPFPYAAEDHQRLNAEPWAEKGAAKLVLDRDFNGKAMLEKASELLNDPVKLSKMSDMARTFHQPDAAKMIADKIMQIASDRKL